MLLVAAAAGTILSIALVVIGIVLVLLAVTRIGGLVKRILVGIIVNSVLGFMVLFAAGYFFGMTMQYTIPEIAAVLLFGLPGVGTMLILKVFGGIALAAI